MLYQIKCDGSLVYSSASEELAHIVLNPKLALDINDAGTLDFTLPPGNAMHSKLNKLKSIITMEQDGVEIFRGRALEDETDIYNQRIVYCEGQKSFLADSRIAPYTYNGTVRGLYTKLINNHNAKVDASKRFSVGTIDAVSASETVTIENKNYANTESEIESKLLGAYGGYLRVRTVGDTRYLDWVKEYGGTNSQRIEFAVNLLDLRNKISAKDVFTVLYPIGAVQVTEEGEYTDPLTIASVNGGLEYIQDDAAIALFGRIERSYTWSHIKSATELLAKGREHLKTGIAVRTLTLKAIDMHIIDGSASAINVGDKVRIVSNPHGIDLTMVCSRIVIDPINPENTEYTFGEKPRVLSDNVADNGNDVDTMTGRGGGGGRKSLEEEMQDIIRWAKINVDDANARILLSAGEVDKLKGRTTTAELAIDGVKGEISSKVSKNGVVSAINQTPETILIKASKINLEGYVTASQLEAEMAAIDNLTSGVTEAAVIKATMLNCTSIFMFQNSAVSWGSKSVVTGVTLTQSKNVAKVRGADGSEITLNYVTNVTPSPSYSTMQYLTKTS
jgi:phage minor structural protein